ncbi:MAG: energy transducer TonB [Bacteroidetes bacterium]|uniref:Energy transducer TonB n=1 Tax=Phaeocystidibacter marisrubri TaxID=1577780 RepID=A0A6L3ZH36_9FLAO|nr:energy transducer TonB [Phaeocystidibacter marisrubri]KAB2816933.1 energy transducer TonB [Phaeocystidibacter marisrubri]TNE27569.1 MAG: energy transducer TonB [Bacteroidota bacterium]GGH77537.1 protein TonB [Phaeocystidibacter marisrubri]
MKSRKNFKADLESKRGLFRDIGLVLGLFAVYIMFAHKTYAPQVEALQVTATFDDEMIIPITERPQEPPPPPPEAPPEVLEIVENDVEIEEIEFESTEVTEDTEIALIDEIPEASDEIMTFVNVENKPVFPGCEDEPTEDAKFLCFQTQINNRLVREFEFPEMSRQMGSQGKVWIDFVIEKDGSVSNVTVARSSGDEYIDREAVRCVQQELPKFVPAKSGGRAVRMRYTVPINAKLQ